MAATIFIVAAMPPTAVIISVATRPAPDARKATGEDIKTVQFGWPLGMPLVRKMKPGVWEVRSSIPAGIARVLFTTAWAVQLLAVA